MKTGTKEGRSRSMSTLSLKLMEYAMWILVIVIVICIGILGCRSAYDLGYRIFDREKRNVEARQLSVTITDGQSTGEVAEALEKAGIIDSALVFKLQGFLYNLKIVPGTYIIDTRTSSLELFEKFNEGPGIENGAG